MSRYTSLISSKIEKIVVNANGQKRGVPVAKSDSKSQSIGKKKTTTKSFLKTETGQGFLALQYGLGNQTMQAGIFALKKITKWIISCRRTFSAIKTIIKKNISVLGRTIARKTKSRKFTETVSHTGVLTIIQDSSGHAGPSGFWTVVLAIIIYALIEKFLMK